MSDNLSSKKILLIGAGPMAINYANVLNEIGVSYEVVGRGEASAAVFQEKTGKSAFVGGLEKFATNKGFAGFTHAIVATPVDALAGNTILLCEAGLKSVLLEKPAGLNLAEMERVKDAADKSNSRVLIGYNRRYYESVQMAREIIEQDGGVTSFTFDFTEWAHKIQNSQKSEKVLATLLYGNSTHVIDLAFFLGGYPKELNAHRAGKLDWHQNSIYTGSGVTENGALFSYHANWESAGRWGVEIMTNAHKLILRPLEDLSIQDRGSIAVKQIYNSREEPMKTKPGLFKEVKTFINDEPSLLPTIEEQAKTVKEVYSKIAGY